MPKNQGSLGFSIIGGTDHSCVPFGAREPGIFISHVSVSRHIVSLVFFSISIQTIVSERLANDFSYSFN